MSEFHPADLAFVQAWSERAPGIDGWRILLDRDVAAQCISVIPPGAEAPVFILTRKGAKTQIERRSPQRPDEAPTVVGEFANPRLAVQALCPLHDDDLQTINEHLELAYPRARRD